MSKAYPPDRLVGAAEIAERLGVGPRVIHDWRYRHPEFPKPVLELRMGLIWDWQEVEVWARSTGRLS